MKTALTEKATRQRNNLIPHDPVTGPLTLVLLSGAQTGGTGFHR